MTQSVIAATRRARQDLDLPIYEAVCADAGMNPLAPIGVKVIVTKRDRHRVGKLTQAVWDSLDDKGDVIPGKAVPIGAVNTSELPVVVPSGEAASGGSASV